MVRFKLLQICNATVLSLVLCDGSASLKLRLVLNANHLELSKV